MLILQKHLIHPIGEKKKLLEISKRHGVEIIV